MPPDNISKFRGNLEAIMCQVLWRWRYPSTIKRDCIVILLYFMYSKLFKGDGFQLAQLFKVVLFVL